MSYNIPHFILFVIVGVFLLFHKTQQQQGNINHTTTTLSQARASLASTSLGELVFFGGGYNGSRESDRVDIYNVTSGIWTTTTLSIPRDYLAATSSQNLVFFSGGELGTTFYNQVDIYNTLNGSWSTATLSQPRSRLAATSVGNLVLFGGGYNSTGSSNVVDVFNVTSNTWTTATLSQARVDLAATSVSGRYALFAGGDTGSGPSNVVDIFDSLSGMWNATTLSQARYDLAATSLGNLAFFGGGHTDSGRSNVVDIFNSTKPTWSIPTLSQARSLLAASSIGEIVAFGGGRNASSSSFISSVVDMLNVTSNTWFIVTLSQPRYSLASTSSTNKIFFGGGYTSSEYSDVVDIFEVSLTIPPPSPSQQTSSTSSTPTTSTSTSSTLTPASSASTSSTLTPASSASASSTLTPASSASTSSTLTPASSASTSSTPEFSTSTPSIPMFSNTTNLQYNDNLSSEAIIGIVVSVIGVSIGIGIVLFVFLFIKKRKKRKTKQRESSSIQLQPEQQKVTQNNEKNITYLELQEYPTKQSEKASQSQLQVSTQKHSQILFNELVIEKEIGEGSYGRVCLGKWNAAPVALKFCKKKGKIEDFMKEVKLMIELPPHPNVVQMFGVSLDGPQPVIVLEYCDGGSLDTLLFDQDNELTDESKIQLVRGIAAGMLHLHKHNIVHRDLAARNILLTGNGTPKISDFGMSRILEGKSEGKTYSNVGPIRWMSPESLGQQIYSKKSDVWSFGIVVWEIVAQSEPHIDVDPLDIGPLIRDQCKTPTIPENCPQKLRELMQMCWKKEPEQRPDFETICAMLLEE